MQAPATLPAPADVAATSLLAPRRRYLYQQARRGSARPARTSPTATVTVPQRLGRVARQKPALSSDAAFNLLVFGIGALLVVAGLALAIGVSGGLATAGGILLVVLGLGVVLFGIYAIGLGKNMGH